MTQRSICFWIIWWGQCSYIKGEDFIFSTDLSKVDVLRTNSTTKIGNICNPCALNLKGKTSNPCALNLKEKKCNLCALHIEKQFVTHEKERNLTPVLLICTPCTFNMKGKKCNPCNLNMKGKKCNPCVLNIEVHFVKHTRDRKSTCNTQTLQA